MRARVNRVLAAMGTFAFTACLAGQPRVRLMPPSPAARTQVALQTGPALLPSGATHVASDPKQMFQLTGPHGAELTVVPVDFNLPNQAAGVLRHSCGVYVVPAQGAAYFLDGTSQDDDLPVQCWKIVAVRLARKAAGPPDIVVTGSDSLTTHSWMQDYVLTRGGDGKYTLSADFKDAAQ